MTRRTRGREIALQVLYQLDQNPGQRPAEVDRFIERRLRRAEALRLRPRPRRRASASTRRGSTAAISDVAENWRIDRMAAIDRNILRLGAYELLYCADVPDQGGHQRGPRTGQAVQHRPVEPVRQRRSSTASRPPTRRGPSPRPRPSRRSPPPTRGRRPDAPDRPRGELEGFAAAARRPGAATGGADLHVHTTHSDGACSPCEVVRAAANVGLAALAITDHDTVSAIAIARVEADRLGLELVGGVELTAEPRRPRGPHPRPLRPRRRPRTRAATAALRRPGRAGSRRCATGWRPGPDRRPRRDPADLPAGHDRPEAPGRLARADRAGGGPPRGVRPLSGRRRPGAGAQAPAPWRRGHPPDPRGRRGCRPGPSAL